MSKVNWVINRRCVEPYGGGVGMDHQKKFMDIPYCIQYGRGHSVLYTGSRGNSHTLPVKTLIPLTVLEF